MSDDSDNEKTEEPSPEKLRKAKEEGNIPRSKDAGSIAASAGVLLLLGAVGPSDYLAFRGYLQQTLVALGSPGGEGLTTVLPATGRIFLLLTLPLAAAAALAGSLMTMAEVGVGLNWTLIELKWNRIDPMGKFGKIFSPKTAAVNTLLTLGRVVVVGWVTWSIVRDEFGKLARLPRVPMASALVLVLEMMGRIALWSTLALALLAVLDYGYSWFKNHRDLMMSRQEIKDEMEQQEGDPQMKGRMKQRARELAKKGIAIEVKRADVIVANPTHVAVALRYRPDEGAPMVIAKGLDEVAQYIKRLAADAGVPVVESRELARALHAQVKVGKRIPVELFQTVAELLAYVYRLKRRGLRA